MEEFGVLWENDYIRSLDDGFESAIFSTTIFPLLTNIIDEDVSVSSQGFALIPPF